MNNGTYEYSFQRQPEDIKSFGVAVIVAGSRSFNDYATFCELLEARLLQDSFPHCELVFISGMARAGADAMIIQWCEENGFPWIGVAADWNNIDVPGARVAKNRHGKPYNKAAGHQRNRKMAELSAEVEERYLFAFHDGVSPGTANMVDEATKLGITLSLFLIQPDRM